jgi:hemerythrin-like domain-containing protein
MSETKPNELGVQIDSEAVNRYLADKILESAIGEELKKQVDQAVKDMSAYGSPLKNLIAQHIQNEIIKLLQTEYSEQIAAVVREKVTAEFTAELLDKAFEAFRRRAY